MIELSSGTVASPVPSRSTRAEDGVWHSICSFCGAEVYAPRGGWVHVASDRTACETVGSEDEDGIDLPPTTLRYWLNPRHWWHESVYQLHQRDVRQYCWQHDKIHWAWTHRRCGCWRRDPKAVRAVKATIEALSGSDPA